MLTFGIIFIFILTVSSMEIFNINCLDNMYDSFNKHQPYIVNMGEQVVIKCRIIDPMYIMFQNIVRVYPLWEHNFYYDTDKYYVDYENEMFTFIIYNLQITDTGNYMILTTGSKIVGNLFPVITGLFNISINVVISYEPNTEYISVSHIKGTVTELMCPDIIIINHNVDPPEIDKSYKYCWFFINNSTGEQQLIRDIYEQSLMLTNTNVNVNGWYACTLFTKIVVNINNTKSLHDKPVFPFIGLFKVDRICKSINEGKITKKNRKFIVYNGFNPIRYYGKISFGEIQPIRDTFFTTALCYIIDIGVDIILSILLTATAPIDYGLYEFCQNVVLWANYG